MMTGRHGRGTVTASGLVLEREAIKRLAIVDLGDGGGVELAQRKRRVEYSAAEAIELGQKLIDLGLQAQIDRDGYLGAEPSASRAVPLAHGFDVAPSCRECTEGKHGACNGQALVESASDEVRVVGCGCSWVNHKVQGVLA